ncbi:tRNA synthetases class II-domain-containing protein [Lipomyces japonicus]|uniref:tRNA synthetases class II-domain-containing protein n=1 Tax=Lipomyces japonicus TaxID=56871 RepID=UPI0034CF3396
MFTQKIGRGNVVTARQLSWLSCQLNLCRQGNGQQRRRFQSCSTALSADQLAVSYAKKFLFPKATHTASQIHQDHKLFELVAQTSEPELLPRVVLHGWIDSKVTKKSSKLAFARLRDANPGFSYAVAQNNENESDSNLLGSAIQLVEDLTDRTTSTTNVEDGDDENSTSLLRKQKQESCVCVIGRLSKSFLKREQLEIKVDRIVLLNTPPPDLVSQIKLANEWDAKYRYLQLRTPALQRALAVRSHASRVVREVLLADGFTEVETPLLFKSTPEGAREFLVPTRRKTKMYALPQSPQQYKQLLMAGGVHRYFQIAKCFRDEDLRQDRQPEFTQVDLEMAFATAEDVQAAVESVIVQLWRQLKQVELATPFDRLKYIDALTRYGIDKPDLRSKVEIIDLSKFVTAKQNQDYPVFEILVHRPSVPGSVDISPSSFGSNGIRNPHAVTYDPAVPWITEFIPKFQLELAPDVGDVVTVSAAIAQSHGLRPGDQIYGCTRQVFPFENPTPLGRLRQQIVRNLFATEATKNVTSALWVVDFPLFTPVETGIHDGYAVFDYAQLISTHHPFTMPHLDHVRDVLAIGSGDNQDQIDPRIVLGQHYDVVINGVEVGGGSTRIHVADLQRHVLTRVLKVATATGDHATTTTSKANPFAHLLTALSMACPPHAGLALGFDRLCAMLYGTESIRDVIAFPKTVTGVDPVVDSPSKVTNEQLADYFVKLATTAAK